MSTLLMCLLAVAAKAQIITDDVRQEALKLAEQIEAEHLIFDENWALNHINQSGVSSEEKLSLMRGTIMSGFTDAKDKSEIKPLITTYREAAQNIGSKRDQTIAEFFDDFLQIENPNTALKVNPNLTRYFNSTDWFIQHRAYYFNALFSPQASSTSVALQYAQDAFNLIPKVGSNESEQKYTREAKILSYTNLALLHNLMGHPGLSMQTTKEEILLRKESGEPINGSAIINDLIFAFSVWRDHKTVESLTETLLRLEENSASKIPGLTELRASNAYIQTGNFQKSLSFADKAIRISELESFKTGATLNRIISLAGLSKTKMAEAELAKFEAAVSDKVKSKGSVSQKLYHIKSLIALSHGDLKKSNAYTNARMDSVVNLVLTRNNSETANMLASLQNSKERRSEREDALEREAGLKQVALDRQRRIIWLLFAMAAVMAVLALGAFAFARYRSRAAEEMSVAAENAKAGDKAKSEFLAVMSHELRTPLNGILGMADIMSRTAPDEATKSKNDIILKSGNELLALVENIFDMTLIESGDMEAYPAEIDLHALIRSKTEDWREDIEAKNIIYTVHVDPSVPRKLEIDRDRFGQCLKNLLSNAVKFTMAGRIHVHVTAATDPANAALTELKVIIADTGMGINDTARAALFQPFRQADYSMTREFGGAGLGLAITQSLARIMEGDVTVSSREGRGSEFTLTIKGTIPKAAQQTASAGQIIRALSVPNSDPAIRQVLADQISRQEQNILVVDDDGTCQKVIESLLKPTGCQLTCVSSGAAALQALSVNTYDVVIMDIRMPGMDGVTAVRRIRESRKAHGKIPIIVLTADTTQETRTRCMAAGANIFLTKPVKPEEFYHAIDYVHKRAESEQRRRA